MTNDGLRAQLKQRLESERAFGVTEIPGAAVRAASAGKAAALAALHDEFKDCQMCSLGATRTNLVFGSGNPEAELMFVGEAPGFDEDRQGLPFVGAAGQLLTKIIQAMKLTREKVYIANCLKCRPPGNRNPLPTELVTCHPILMRQIDIIRPKVVCALGKFAAQTVLSTQEPISRLRGRFFDAHGTRVMPTFHPAYLLRNPADKKLAWEDAKMIMKELRIS
jgi:DNA polymerase